MNGNSGQCLPFVPSKRGVYHLLLYCKVAWEVWYSILRVLIVDPPRTIIDLFAAWNQFLGSPKGKIMWRLSFVAIIWALWK